MMSVMKSRIDPVMYGCSGVLDYFDGLKIMFDSSFGLVYVTFT